MESNRRDFLKSQALAASAAAAGIPIVVEAAPNVAGKSASDVGVRWDKAPCRFCGTGCAVLVGVQNDKVVATQGDPEAPVNRGLNCIKGYFLSKIMYGKDRLTTPLLRKKNGKTHRFTVGGFTAAIGACENDVGFCGAEVVGHAV